METVPLNYADLGSVVEKGPALVRVAPQLQTINSQNSGSAKTTNCDQIGFAVGMFNSNINNVQFKVIEETTATVPSPQLKTSATTCGAIA